MVDISNLSPSALAMLKAMQSVNPDLRITSGFRSPEYNKKVGGAKRSRHTHGDALDVSLAGLGDDQKVQLLNAAIGSGARGVGIYPNGSLHVDTRETPAFWGVGGSYRGADPSMAPTWAQPSLFGMFGKKPDPNYLAATANAKNGAEVMGTTLTSRPGPTLENAAALDTPSARAAIPETPEKPSLGTVMQGDKFQNAMAQIANGLGGGGSSEGSRDTSTITPSAIGNDGQQAAIAGSAAQLMSALMQRRNGGLPGMSLPGIGGMGGF